MARLLPRLGIAPTVVVPTPWPDLFSFLLDESIRDRSREWEWALRETEAVIALDVSDLSRLGQLAATVRDLAVPRIAIDHHVLTDEPAGDVLLADPTACATAELVFDFAFELGLEIEPPVAEAIYCAILTDTGGFRYSNTSPRAHAIAAVLLQRGVDPETMYRRIYASYSPQRLELLREALATLGVDPEHGISWISLASDTLRRYEVSSEDLDGIVEHPRSIAGTRVALFFRDLGHGKVKVSFRSTGDVDVNRLARMFGGGGHEKAAGALIPGTLDSVREEVLAATRAYLRGSAPLALGE